MPDSRTPAEGASPHTSGAHARPPEVDRVAASRRAVAARRERAALKKDVAMRVITPQELLRRALADPASPAGAMRVPEFLTAIPAIGEGKRDRILHDLEISPVKRLGGLGSRQRGGPSELPGRPLARARAPRRSQPPGRAGRTHRGGQGHGRRAHQGASPRDPAVGVGDDAGAAPGRGRRRALLLRRRRRVRPA